MIGYINDEDLRSRYVKELFKEVGMTVTSSMSKVKEADFLYLGVKANNYLHVFLKPGCRVYTLIEDKEMSQRCKEEGYSYHYLYDDEELIEGNTYLTTEALIGYMVIDNDHSIKDSSVLIVGYGNCGKDLAKKLKAMQAKITVTNRKYRHKEEVLKTGYRYRCLETLKLTHYDYIINTVPSQVLTKEILDTKEKHAKIYDIASTPYGVAKENRTPEYYILSSLPSKYAYKSAAKLIYKAIMKKEDKNVKR